MGCPEKKISGGKVLFTKSRRVRSRVATALRMGAQSLHHAKDYLGEFFRRITRKLGRPQAITATAHKLARIVFHLLSTKEEYTESVFHKSGEDAIRRAQYRLRRQAAQLGFQVIPLENGSCSLGVGIKELIRTSRAQRHAIASKWRPKNHIPKTNRG
jgi:transposase